MNLTGDNNNPIQLVWTQAIDDQLERTYADQQDATEDAAVCMAILLGIQLTGHTVVERSVKGTGIDYWLGDPGDILFQRKARLEVSGTFDGDGAEVEARFKEKCAQTNRSAGTGLPAYVSVTGFQAPHTKFARTP